MSQTDPTGIAAAMEHARAEGLRVGSGIAELRRQVEQLEADPWGRPGGGDPSSGVVKLPDDAIEAAPLRQQVVRYLAEQFPHATLADHQFGADGLLAIFDSFAARVRAEALREAAAPVGISQSVGELRLTVTLADNLDDRVEWLNALCARVRAEAVADERQRIARFLRRGGADLLAHWMAADQYDVGNASAYTLEAGIRVERLIAGLAAGSVPVATPEPSEPYRACAGCDGPDLCKFCGYRAAIPTEPPSDELLDKWAAAVTLPGECAAQLVDEVRRLRAAMASPVPAEQPEER